VRAACKNVFLTNCLSNRLNSLHRFSGSDGFIIPNTTKWWNELYIAGDSFNVNAVVVHSLVSCLELCYWLLLSRNGLSEDNIKSLGMLIDNTRCHLWKLKEMCSNLLSIPRGRKGQAKIAAAKETRTKIPRVRLYKLTGGTKEHIAGKYPFYYK